MVSEKMTVGISVMDREALCEFLDGKNIKCLPCGKVEAGKEKYFILGPMDASYKNEIKELAESYEVLGPGEGNLDEIANYREEHGCE